jgi:outer membrane receptor protein involved in Fe transport
MFQMVMPARRGRSFAIAIVTLMLCTPWSVRAAEPSDELAGLVVGEKGGAPIADAVVTLVELNRRTVTDREGRFRFTRMPPGTFTIGVHAISYSSAHRSVEVPSLEPLILTLKPDSHFQEEVTVTAMPWAVAPLETAQSVDQVDQKRIKGEGSSSVGGVLEHVPGLANIGTGDALGTPVIRGVSENRVRVMNDGVPVNHQQWSSRHSPNIDPAMAERVEVVRGPASVMWGPDAMGGVVNVVHPALPTAPEGQATVHGDFGVGYFSNNDQGQGQFSLEGAWGGFGWRAGVVRRNTGDMETPAGTLDNTDYSQTNGTVSLGYSGDWGAARLRWLHWDNEVGFFFPESSLLNGFRLDLTDDVLAFDTMLPTGQGDFEVSLSRQDNSRLAINPAAPVYPEAAINLNLVTTTARAGFRHDRWGPWKGNFAVEYRAIENTTLASDLLPNYDAEGYSVMIFEEGRFLPVAGRSFERLILSLGLRWDGSNLVVPNSFDRDYNAPTGSVGLVYRATERLSLAANLGRGWRQPNAFELFADGIHGGVAAYQLGNPDLEEESNVSSELSLRYQSRHWRAVFTGYRSDYDDFIYLRDTGEVIQPEDLPVFSYAQTDATIDGVEGSVEVVPLEQLQLRMIYSSVDTRNDSTGTLLPQTPPDRINFMVRGMTPELGALASPYVELEGVWVAEGVPSGPDEPYYASGNAATDSYDVWHLRAGFQVVADAGVFGVDLTVRNLLDEEYTGFLYPYKVFGVPNAGRDARLLVRFQF